MYKFFKIFLLIIFKLVFLCQIVSSAEEKIKIGLLVPLTGDNQNLGQQVIKSVRIALKDINTSTLEIHIKDTNSNQTQETILKDLMERDKRDITRQIAPLKRLSDAFFIDSSSLNADEVLQIALNYING